MKRILTLAALAAIGPMASLVGCEGEPPVQAPENATGTCSPRWRPSAAAGEQLQAAPEAPPATACPPPPCTRRRRRPPRPRAQRRRATSSAASAEVALAGPAARCPARGNIVGNGDHQARGGSTAGRRLPRRRAGPKTSSEPPPERDDRQSPADELHPVRLGRRRGRKGHLRQRGSFPSQRVFAGQREIQHGQYPAERRSRAALQMPLAPIRFSATFTPECSGTCS